AATRPRRARSSPSSVRSARADGRRRRGLLTPRRYGSFDTPSRYMNTRTVPTPAISSPPRPGTRTTSALGAAWHVLSGHLDLEQPHGRSGGFAFDLVRVR